MLNRLNGMFDFAVWDVKKQRLVLARDPFGIKLLYYRVDGNRLYFGSEMRAIRATMPGRPEIDPAALNLFLRYRYTPSPYTILKGVRKLAPGTKLTVQNGSYEVSRWYQFKPVPFSPAKSVAEAREELQKLYREAVKRQLISDVPVGLLLSGGIDSGLLLALMKENGASWPTYSVGYGTAFADDELADAAETARILGSKHTSVTISRTTFEATLPKIVAALEEPIAASSIVPMYFVCERARQERQGRLGWTGTGRIVWRLSASSRSPLCSVVGGIAGLGAYPNFLGHRRSAQERDAETGSLFPGDP